MSHSFSIMLLNTQSLHFLGVAGHAVFSFLALVLPCLRIAAAVGLGTSSPGSGLAAGTSLHSWHNYIFWLLSRFLRVFHESALLFPHILLYSPYAFTYSVTFSSYPFPLPFSLTYFVLLSLKNQYKHHRNKTTIQKKGDPCCPQFREGNVST